jgi:tRNA (uracil-5-)-methyltransferase
MRAEFRIWHDWSTETGQCNYVMFEKDQPKVPVIVSDYAIGNQAITELMPALIDFINQSQTLKHKLFQIEFLSTSTNEVLVSLIYHRQLDDNWQQAAIALEQDFGIQVIGRAKKQRLVISRDYVTEKLIINQQAFYYQQQENSFTQPNAAINCKMIEWVCSQLPGQENRDLLELYCGNGNFTIPLAQKFNKVLATEVSKSSIKLAQVNCNLNNTSNIEFVRLSSDETASALNQEREFRRLKHIDISDYDFSTVLVDPPRAGLDCNTLALVSGFETIIYISCNPITLSENLETLSQTHEIERFALFDQFPYTDHCECGMILVRKINDQ